MTQTTPLPPLQVGPKQRPWVDLMRAGDGTPWENRGDIGAISGLLGTCIRAITKPGALLDHIRNTNVPGDSNSFVWICGILWAIAVVTHRVTRYFILSNDPQLDVDAQLYWIETLVLASIAVPWVFLMHRLLGTVFYKIVGTEFRSPVPKVLVTNVVAYCLGASILAPIPFYIGPGLAVFFIFMAMTVAGAKRLYITWRGAIIDSILTLVCAVGLTVGLGVLFILIWGPVMDNHSVVEKPQPKAVFMNQ